jgi:uncharacterized small protein (DUF1192 family)
MLTVADHRGKSKAVPEAKITQVNEKIATLRQEIQRLDALNRRMMHGARQTARHHPRSAQYRSRVPGSNNPGVLTSHLPIAQLPGFSQGGGTARVTAAASMKAVSSIPFATAEMRQR